MGDFWARTHGVPHGATVLCAQLFMEFINEFNRELHAKNEKAVVLVHNPTRSLTGCVKQISIVEGILGRPEWVVDTLKAVFRAWFMRAAVTSPEWTRAGVFPRPPLHDVLFKLFMAGKLTMPGTIQRSWWRAGSVLRGWLSRMDCLKGKAAAGVFDGLVLELTSLQLVIEEFKSKCSSRAFMTAWDFVGCDKDLIEKWAPAWDEEDESEDEKSAYFCIPKGPLMWDNRSCRRVSRMVHGGFVKHAEALGIQPRDVPEEAGVVNEEVVSRLRRTPTKRTRAGSTSDEGITSNASDGEGQALKAGVLFPVEDDKESVVRLPLLCKLVNARHKAITNKMTDHWNAVMVAIKTSAVGKRGPGIWRLRATQTKRKGVREKVMQVIRDTGGDLAVLLPRLSACLWEYSREERKQVKATQAHLEREVETWAGIKSELDGEATSGFLTGKIKTRKARTEVHEVKLKGNTYTGATEVLAAATEFFEDSFGGGNEADQEVRTAVRELAPGKTWGQDGLPKELFEHNWDLLGPVMMQFVGAFTHTPKLPDSVSTAVTILLHNKGSKEDLGNYRPITLLSTVYKILAKVLASRLKNVLHEVISEYQVGFLPGRKLADAVTVVADAIKAGASGREDWYLLMVNFRKAFDSISRPFLFRTLRRMGIPEVFVSWAEGLHKETGTRVHLNGWTGETVAVKKGVRQGCPFAPYLFLCAVEPLCQELSRCKLGIGRRDMEKLTYLGYADDSSLLLGGAEQVSVAAGVLDDFGKKSGLKVNLDKTVLLPLGKNRGKPPLPDLQYKWADKGEPEWLLGVWITPNGDPLPS
ncbi:unnamed protein product [Closterium sp. Yama58-4]|nr:unnamed protein product [Closterium sp. Yama58-4]